jgi:hypothetical protein
VDPQNLQTIAQQYFDSVKDRRNQHLITKRYTNLSEASARSICSAREKPRPQTTCVRDLPWERPSNMAKAGRTGGLRRRLLAWRE